MNTVTGAFGYIGKYITKHLLERGEQVNTVTTHPDKPNPFGATVEVFPYDFDSPEKLIDHLSGTATLYNTYWIRFGFDGATFERAVRNTAILFSCAREAGVERIVHISVTNASMDSSLPYYRGKGEQEALAAECGVEYSIVRPTLVFGPEDILVNNIGWLLRHFPVFPIFGDGKYRLQPVFVEDLARIAVESADSPPGTCIDAIGPEKYTFEEFVTLIEGMLDAHSRLVRVPPAVGIAAGRIIGYLMSDVLLTRDELRGLMNNCLTSDQEANGTTLFSEWLEENKEILGDVYSSELDRHFRWRRG